MKASKAMRARIPERLSPCCGAELIKQTILYEDKKHGGIRGRDGGYVCSKCHKPVEEGNNESK